MQLKLAQEARWDGVGLGGVGWGWVGLGGVGRLRESTLAQAIARWS